MDKLKQIHHSLEDWDFDPRGFLYIESGLYFSPPSCLAVPDEGYPDSFDWVFLKPSLAPNLKQGRVTIYDRFMKTTMPHLNIYFRCQAIPALDIPANTYRAKISLSTWEVRVFFDGGGALVDSGNLTFTREVDTWYFNRLTFWTYINAALENVLRVKWEIYLDGSWVEQFLVDIANPRWEDSDVNLIGLNPQSSAITTRHYVDDTIVEEKA